MLDTTQVELKLQLKNEFQFVVESINEHTTEEPQVKQVTIRANIIAQQTDAVMAELTAANMSEFKALRGEDVVRTYTGYTQNIVIDFIMNRDAFTLTIRANKAE